MLTSRLNKMWKKKLFWFLFAALFASSCGKNFFTPLFYNGMLCHSLEREVIFISSQHFILPYFTYCPACKPEVRGIAIRAVSQVGQNKVLLRSFSWKLKSSAWKCYYSTFLNINLINLTFCGGKALVNKLWPSLFKWVELDLWLIKSFVLEGKFNYFISYSTQFC